MIVDRFFLHDPAGYCSLGQCVGLVLQGWDEITMYPELRSQSRGAGPASPTKRMVNGTQSTVLQYENDLLSKNSWIHDLIDCVVSHHVKSSHVVLCLILPSLCFPLNAAKMQLKPPCNSLNNPSAYADCSYSNLNERTTAPCCRLRNS